MVALTAIRNAISRRWRPVQTQTPPKKLEPFPNITVEGVVVKRPQAPQLFFHYENLNPISHLLKPGEEIEIGPDTTLKLNKSNLLHGVMGFGVGRDDQPSHPFHAEVSITHPIKFSLYGKEKDRDLFAQITDGMEISGDKITIPALHMKSKYSDYAQYHLLVFDNEKREVVAAVHFRHVSGHNGYTDFLVYSHRPDSLL